MLKWVPHSKVVLKYDKGLPPNHSLVFDPEVITNTANIGIQTKKKVSLVLALQDKLKASSHYRNHKACIKIIFECKVKSASFKVKIAKYDLISKFGKFWFVVRPAEFQILIDSV